MIADVGQMAKDLQRIIADAVNKADVYEAEPPRASDGSVVLTNPVVVYTAAVNSPVTENGVFNVDLFLDVWARGGWADCYREAMLLDAALDGEVYDMPSGVLCCDRNGLVMNRGERDPEDERIRRMSGQYLIRLYPNV